MGESKITLETLRTVFMRAIEKPARGVPALIGPAQWGKTHYGRKWLLEAGTDSIVMVNPQTDLPEDIAGWPVRRANELTFTQPSIIPLHHLKPKAPRWALFIDELDKAKEDTLSAMLTLLNPGERRLREVVIPPETPIAVAMNEPRRELPEPLVARLLFMPFPPEGFEMQPRIASSSLLAPPDITVPTRPHAPGSYFKLKEWLSVPEFQRDEAVRIAVISGLFPREVVPSVLESFGLAKTRIDHWAENCTIAEFVENWFMIAESTTSIDELDAVQMALAKRQREDKTDEFSKAIYYVTCQHPIGARWHHWTTPTESPRGQDFDQAKDWGRQVAADYKKQAKK